MTLFVHACDNLHCSIPGCERDLERHVHIAIDVGAGDLLVDNSCPENSVRRRGRRRSKGFQTVQRIIERSAEST
jgi:hypothetical protein